MLDEHVFCYDTYKGRYKLAIYCRVCSTLPASSVSRSCFSRSVIASQLQASSTSASLQTCKSSVWYNASSSLQVTWQAWSACQSCAASLCMNAPRCALASEFLCWLNFCDLVIYSSMSLQTRFLVFLNISSSAHKGNGSYVHLKQANIHDNT